MRNFGPPVREQIRRHILIVLALALAPAFTVTALVNNAYRGQQRALATSWAGRGEVALAARRPDEAIDAFRNALSFSREDRAFRLRLAQALVAAGRRPEARAYLLALWEDQPGNGPVNLELARIAAMDGDVSAAMRYYHNAIEGAWSEEVEARRRQARLELADFLVRAGASVQAESELIALGGDLPRDAPSRERVAGLMLRAGLAARALLIYRDLLASRPDDAAALEGAGRAAFATRSYTSAVSYLARASRQEPLSDEAATELAVARLVTTLDPFQRRLSRAERSHRTLVAFDAASARLRTCPAPLTGDLQALEDERAGLVPRLKRRALARDQDLVDAAMDLAFRIETTASGCGAAQPIDRALLLIAGQHEGA